MAHFRGANSEIQPSNGLDELGDDMHVPLVVARQYDGIKRRVLGLERHADMSPCAICGLRRVLLVARLSEPQLRRTGVVSRALIRSVLRVVPREWTLGTLAYGSRVHANPGRMPEGRGGAHPNLGEMRTFDGIGPFLSQSGRLR